MIVVSNASPLIGLARIGKLSILPGLYSSILIPDAVWQEVVLRGSGHPGAAEIAAAAWIEKRGPTDRQIVSLLQRELDTGEAEAIALAVEVKAELLLMDEALGRKIAAHLGLRTVGTVGLLVEGKHQGLIREIASDVRQLHDIAGFHLSPDLVERVLRDEGEIS